MTDKTTFDKRYDETVQNKCESNTIELPCFDELAALAKLDPDALEILRVSLCNQIIDSAHEKNKKRLKGLQFKINTIRAYSKSNIALCVKLAAMMNDSLNELNLALTQPQERLQAYTSHTAQIIPFPRRQ